MQFWRDLSVSTKVIAAFALVFVNTLGLGVFGLSHSAAINSIAADVRDDWLPSAVQLGMLTAKLEDSRIKEARLVTGVVAQQTKDFANDMAMFKQQTTWLCSSKVRPTPTRPSSPISR